MVDDGDGHVSLVKVVAPETFPHRSAHLVCQHATTTKSDALRSRSVLLAISHQECPGIRRCIGRAQYEAHQQHAPPTSKCLLRFYGCGDDAATAAAELSGGGGDSWRPVISAVWRSRPFFWLTFSAPNKRPSWVRPMASLCNGNGSDQSRATMSSGISVGPTGWIP